MSQVPTLLKFGMYTSELLIINVLFYLMFHHELSPGSKSLEDVSSLYGFMSMSLCMAYVIGIWLRPISFYYRTSKRGSIVGNVTMSVFWMALLFITFLVIVGRLRLFSTSSVKLFNLLNISIPKLLPFFVSVMLLLIIWRYVARYIIRALRSNGRNVHRVVMVGASDNIVELCQEMTNPFYGYKVMGYFNEIEVPALCDKVPYLGTVKDVTPYIESHSVHQLYCALPSALANDIKPIINACESNCVRFFSVPNVRNYLKRTMQLELLGSIPVLCIREDPLSSLTNRIVKRTFDIVVSGLFMIPFWVIIYPIVAIISHITMPGPVFFKQQRNGLNGETFLCYKFRSMKVNADADKLQATENDPRKTKWGNIMRKTSIDELPQFINVLKGEMSIVGPRPHMVKHTEEYSALIDKYMVRHWVRPGISGWAQVTGARGETKELWQMEDRIKKDIWYVENWSLWLDIKIIFLTVYNALGGDKQAY